MKRIHIFAIFLFIGLAGIGCNEERRTIYQIDLGVQVNHRAHIDNVILYLFDNKDELLGSEQGDKSTWFDVGNYQSGGQLGAVAWGNVLSGGMEIVSPPPPFARHLFRAMTRDSMASFAGHQLSRTPPDLFFGCRNIEFVEQYNDRSIGSNRYIVGKIDLRRVVASYAITVRNASSAFGEPATDLTLLVRNPYSGLNFSGTVVGTPTYTVPRATYDAATDELKTAINIALPTGDSSVVVEIYRADELLFSTASSRDADGLKFTADTFHNIVIDKQNQSTINVIPAHWGEQSLDALFD